MQYANRKSIKSKKKVVKYFLYYVMIILLFSLFYYQIWIQKPNSFIINDYLNSKPLTVIIEETINHQENYSFLNTPPTFFDYYDTIGMLIYQLSKTDKHARNFLDTLKTTSYDYIYPGKIADSLNIIISINPYNHTFLDSVKIITKQYLTLIGDDSLSLPKIYKELFSNDKSMSITNFNSLHRRFISDDLLPNNSYIKITIERLVQNIYYYYLTLLAYQDLSQLLEEQFKATMFNKKCKSYIINVMKKYYQDYNIRKPEIRECFHYLNEIENDLKRLYNKTDMYTEFQETRLRYIDFLYFSVITSTTTGYGDIAPNSIEIRFCVIIQTITSLIVFGLFINFIRKKDRNSYMQ